MNAHRPGLRARFVVACGLLVATSTTAGVWTLSALARLSALLGRTVEGIDEAAAATSTLAGALEREDDALLLTLADSARGRPSLVAKRAVVDAAAARLLGLRVELPLPPAATRLRDSIGAYRRAADRIIADRHAADRQLRYHRDANPLLHDAVAQVTETREQFSKEAQRVPAVVQADVVRARRIVLMISTAALAVSVATLLHFVRFFRRLNLGEVLRAKSALEATVQALPDAVVLIDHEGAIVSLNATAEKLLAATDKRPARAEDLVIEGFDPVVVREFLARPATEPDAPDLSRALRIVRNGKLFRLLPRLLPVPGLTGGRPGAMLVLYDVTEIAQLDERRAELVAVASHELQTPLTTLRMTLLMLHEDARALSDRQTQLLATSLVGAEQLAQTVNEYLDLTRIEAGQLRLDWDRVDAISLAAGAVARAQAATGISGARIELSAGTPVGALWGDASRLRLVLDNLLSNAIKYTPAGGKIAVSVLPVPGALERAAVRIAVQDPGPGVPAEFRTRIFDKFFRVEHQRSEGDRGLRGSGIGLYLARQIVERHGGSITCQAVEGQRGTRMVVDLPEDGRLVSRQNTRSLARGSGKMPPQPPHSG